ncbi:MAG TPA: phospholipase D-like domain-containing protein [Solirubrobacteraceae bacterium]|jgi:phosphatidylserine/phosphatidylglycerophosphate/cardiolipin synthase-like enzyme
MRTLLAVVCTTAVALLATAAAAPAAVLTTLNGIETEAQFVDPTSEADGIDQEPVLGRMAQMIRATPNDGWIAFGLFSFDSGDVLSAIKDAKARGVRMWAVQSGNQDNPVAQEMRQYVDTKLCHTFDNDACIALKVGDGHPIQHMKYALFSRTKNTGGAYRDNVVWFGTANLTSLSGARLFNDTLTIYNDPALWQDFRELWVAQWNGSPRTSDLYGLSLGHFTGTSGIEVAASPSATTDTVVANLKRITSGAGCEVRVLTAKLTRLDIVDRLVDMKGWGCAVAVVYGEGKCVAIDPLDEAGVLVKQSDKIHSKTILARGTAGTTVVLTGSQNFDVPSLRAIDELHARVPATPALYSGYLNYYARAWYAASWEHGCS